MRRHQRFRRGSCDGRARRRARLRHRGSSGRAFRLAPPREPPGACRPAISCWLCRVAAFGGQPCGRPSSVRGLPIEIRGSTSVGTVDDAQSLRPCPDRLPVDARVVRQPLQRSGRKAPDPDVPVVVGDIECEARAVKRESRVDVQPRRCSDGLFAPLPIYPRERSASPPSCQTSARRPASRRPTA